MKELTESQIKALNKLNSEIEKDIEVAVQLSKNGMLLELIYFIYSLRISRITNAYAEEIGQNTALIKTASNMLEESTKYNIQLLAKYFTPNLVSDKETGHPVVNFKLTEAMTKHSSLINSKYESTSLVQLFDVELLDDKAKQIKIDMKDASKDIDVKKFFDYFLRIDRDNDIKKNSKQTKDTLILNFKDEYRPVDDLFQKSFGISIDEFCDFILWLLTNFETKVKNHENDFERFDNGNVNMESLQTMIAFVPSFLIGEDQLKTAFHPKFIPIIEMLTFNPTKYDEKQLRFHLVSRSPLIHIEKYYIASPELILDSLFINIHYSLLESSSVKEEYKARQAGLYLDKLVAIAKKYGFVEVARDYDLYEGKKQIGDIDLILKDDKNNYLLIEAKNHALPLDVYFKDIAKTKEHLNYLKSKWETKVIDRVKHLEKKHEDYSIPSTYTYIVVSRFPEIISHYSDLLIFSISEFEHWLKKNRWSNSFEIATNDFYQGHEAKYTIEDLEKLSEANLILGKFKKK